MRVDKLPIVSNMVLDCEVLVCNREKSDEHYQCPSHNSS